MGFCRCFLLRNPLTTVQNVNRNVISRFCTKADANENEAQPKTITEQFTEALRVATEKRKLAKQTKKLNKLKADSHREFKGLKPKDDYVPRFEYNGYLKKCTWHYYDEKTKEKLKRNEVPILTEAQEKYQNRKKRNFCLLLGFAGGNYFGMQYNPSVRTIENELLTAMYKNEWILEEHIHKSYLLEFQHGSRTDRGVSAARMNCSLFLPEDINIDDVNRDLPSDIRLFGIKRVTPKFSARHNCSARTYSYTLPTIALSHYNNQDELHEYRVPAERLQRTNEVLRTFEGLTNFHNYTVKKLHFDRSSQRRIFSIGCGEPFMEGGIEFARITVKGESFMYHQIRKMVGFSLAVIRGIVNDDLLASSLTSEEINTPLAPGLGLMLERLHYPAYATMYKQHDPLTFEDCDEAVEKFRHEQIHPVIVETEIRENSMREWLELLCVHSFGAEARRYDNERREYKSYDEYDDDWGEDPEFLKKLNEKVLKDN